MVTVPSDTTSLWPESVEFGGGRRCGPRARRTPARLPGGRALAEGVDHPEGALGDRLGRLPPRPARTAPHVDPAHDGEPAHDDPGRARDDRHVPHFEAPAAHEGEADELDVEAFGHDDLDPAPEGKGGDDDLGTLDLGPAQVHVAPAHDRHRIGLAADAPAALGVVPAEDRHVPTPLVTWRKPSAGRGFGGRRQVGHDGIEFAPVPGLEGSTHAIGELVEGQAAGDDVLAQQVTVRSRSASATRIARSPPCAGTGGVRGLVRPPCVQFARSPGPRAALQRI